MPSAADQIRHAIAEAGGTLPFERFMHLALYGEGGFYTDLGGAGRRGDFITSPEVGPLFGLVMSRAIDATWEAMGGPDGFTIVEVGAGPGTLARSILAASPRCLENGRYIAVESSERQCAQHPDGVISVDRMPERVEHGVVVANELLDNLAFELWVHDDRWREAHVVAQNDRFAEVLVGREPPGFLPVRAPHGARAPVHTGATRWLESALAMLANGSVIVVDYCTPVTAELASMPWRGWLRTYAGHQRGGHYLSEPGTQDITTQVCVDQLVAVREPVAVRTQSQFLQRWGIDELVEEGKRYWNEHAARPTLEAMRMRSRISEAEALLDESGLGGFLVIEWSVEKNT